MIPAEAIEAAAKALVESLRGDDMGYVDASDPRDVVIDIRDFNLPAAVTKILEAAAPHMHRTITATEELDALPIGSIVAMIGSEPDSPAVACRAVRGWQFLGDDPERRYLSSSLLPSSEPITVLHEPRAQSVWPTPKQEEK